MKDFIRNIKKYCFLIITLVLVFLPFAVWLTGKYYTFHKDILWISFIPILSHIIGLLIGVIHNKIKDNEGTIDNHY